MEQMIRNIFRFIIVILLILFGVIGYLSTVGLETTKFNSLIKSNLKNIDNRLDVELNDVKLILNPIELNLNIKTFGPSISYNNNKIELETIKSKISLSSIINKQISSSNLIISTKLINIKNVISFLRSVQDDPKFLIINRMINKGLLIADIELNFDEDGKIKDNYLFKGSVKDGNLDLFNGKQIDKINFTFNIENKNTLLNDITLTYEDIKIKSDQIKLTNTNKEIIIQGNLETNEVSLNKNEISKYFNLSKDAQIKKIYFSSQNNLKLNFNKNFKLENYEVKSSLNLKELVFKNMFNLSYFFPKAEKDIILKNHKIDIVTKKDFTQLKGSGIILLQKEYDEIEFDIIRDKKKFNFDTNLKVLKNSLSLKFLNFVNSKDTFSSLKLIGDFGDGQNLRFKKISLVNEKNVIEINDLNLNEDYKISSVKSAIFNLIDSFDKKIQFSINKNKKNYNITGNTFNASALIDDIIKNDDKANNDIFSKNFDLNIKIKEVLINENDIIKNLNGKVGFKKNKVSNAKINGSFAENENVSLTIINKDGQKVTTFFSEKAYPFVKKFDFVKGFDKGSLDFYSVESGSTSNSQIKIYDFKLKEVPALTKILTLASLQGIADLLSGEGIRFDDFEMKFQNKKNLITINEIYAIGPAISILMEGYIEKNDLISLRGTLVPATTINKAIGSIPVIGELLVGKKTGEGVFGVSFKIKGPPGKTETTVNPIKTLTPRFITRTLEKIKKN